MKTVVSLLASAVRLVSVILILHMAAQSRQPLAGYTLANDPCAWNNYQACEWGVCHQCEEPWNPEKCQISEGTFCREDIPSCQQEGDTLTHCIYECIDEWDCDPE